LNALIIEIKGPIISDSEQWIYDWFEIPATSPSKVNKLLNKAKKNEELEVIINSGGGSVPDGSEIYTSLKEYSTTKGNVVTKIVGIAGSAASYPALAANKVLMSPTAQFMIHNAAMGCYGDYHEMELGAEILKSVNEGIVNAYQIKTGKEHKELLKMMDKETWLNAQKALELGFIDEIMFMESEPNVKNEIQLDKNGMLPREVINKIRNELKKAKPNEPSEEPKNEGFFLLPKEELKEEPRPAPVDLYRTKIQNNERRLKSYGLS
jgi:ATP-dependent Clp protease, protease subunit